MLSNFVYRVDQRPPKIIFQEGFRPWGNNLDFFDHLRGDSGIDAYLEGRIPDDSYISISASTTGAVSFLRTSQEEGQEFPDIMWLYEMK